MQTVYLKTGLSYQDISGVERAVEEIFERSPKAAGLGKHSSVLLKPNLLGRHTPDQAVTTHPAVVQVVVQALRRRGVTQIFLADSPGGLYNEPNMRAIYAASGMKQLADQLGITLWEKNGWREKQGNGQLVHSFNLIEPVLDCDFIINLPKLKTHVMAGLTCGVKNLFGCVPGLQKAQLHMRFPERQAFGQMLCDLYGFVAPGLTIADGIVAMEGDGPSGGSPRQLGVMLGSEDAWVLDLVAAALIGIDPAEVPYLAAGIRQGVCAPAFCEQMLAPGSDPLYPVQGFKLPKGYAPFTFAGSVPKPLRWAVPIFMRWAAPHPVIQKRRCIGCGKCAEICPGHTIHLENKKAELDPTGCIRCFCCHEMCPVKAISVKGLPIQNL